MVNNTQKLDTTFSALADPTRRAIVAKLARGEATVMELARPFAISLPAVSRHLRILEEAGLMVRRREGRVHHCRLAPEPLREAEEWIDHYRNFWEQKLDALSEFLSQENQGDSK